MCRHVVLGAICVPNNVCAGHTLVKTALKRIKSRHMVQSTNRQTGPDPAPENKNYDLVVTRSLNHCKTTSLG